MTNEEAIKILHDIKGAGIEWDMALNLAIKALKRQETAKPEFRVGDEVTNSEGKFAYVLVPEYAEGAIVILAEDYSCPQIVPESRWWYTMKNNRLVRECVAQAYEAMKGDDYDK